MSTASSLPTSLVLNYINKNGLKPGARFPTARALSTELKIGRMALNRAITELVGRRVLDRQGQKLFVGQAGSDRQVRAPLDFFVEKWHDVRPVMQLATRWGMEVRVHRSSETDDRRRQLLDLLESGKESSGVLIYGSECETELLRLQKQGVPIMVFGDRSTRFSFTTYHPRSMVDQALRHLMELGHREIAFVAPPPAQSYPLMHREVESTYVQLCQSMGLNRSAERLLAFVDDAASEGVAWRRLRRNYKEVTALICENLLLVDRMIDLARKDGIAVPKELSVMGVYSQESHHSGDLSVTATYLDERQMLQIATLMLLDDIEKESTASGRPVQKTTLCQPRLFLRESTGQAPKHSAAIDASPMETPSEWSADLAERRKRLRQLNNKPFHTLTQRRTIQYQPVDLTAHVNRRLTSYHGWLGQLPLLHLPSGETQIHGVPCRVLDRALVMRSRFARTVRGKLLPESITIPVERKVDGIFILHAGGWLKYHESMGTYEFARGSRRDRVEIMSYGTGQGSAKELKERARQSIIGDWHPSGFPFDGAMARCWRLTQDGDFLRYLRYLYLYHWRNPHPGTHLDAVKITVHQPTLQATLGILAMTSYCAAA